MAGQLDKQTDRSAYRVRETDRQEVGHDWVQQHTVDTTSTLSCHSECSHPWVCACACARVRMCVRRCESLNPHLSPHPLVSSSTCLLVLPVS